MSKPPSDKTLARYGLTAKEWRAMFRGQKNACAVCKKKGNWFAIDHEHVRGWKKMTPSDRRRYVRGILCYWCNFRYAGRGITSEIALSVHRYLKAYEDRRDKDGVQL